MISVFRIVVLSASITVAGCSFFTVKTQTHRTAGSLEEAIAKNLPTVTPCDIQNSVEEFNGTYFRLEASVVQSLHGFRIEPRNCRADRNEGEAFSPFIALAVVDFEISKLIVARIAANKGKSPDLPKTEIIAIGRFQIVAPSGQSDALRDTLPWQVELYKLEEKVAEIQTDPNNKPEGWKIPVNGKVIFKQTVELDGPQGKEKVEFTRRDVPENTKLVIPYFGGQTDYMVRVQNVEELAREGQFPYAYQLTVTEVCERPQDCWPVSWIIRVRDEDGDKIFETYGGTALPPAWAK